MKFTLKVFVHSYLTVRKLRNVNCFSATETGSAVGAGSGIGETEETENEETEIEETGGRKNVAEVETGIDDEVGVESEETGAGGASPKVPSGMY